MSTNEILGYPPETRLLIVNGDDFGLCHAQNAGIIQSLQKGLLSSCSLMIPAPWSLHAARFLRENPQVALGVHLTAISEYTWYRWKPLTPAERVPSLVDRSGYFVQDDRFDELMDRADIGDLEREFRAQIDAALSLGLHPTHLDTHYGINELREDIFDLTVRLAQEHGLALRVGEKAHVEKLQRQGYPTCDHTVVDSGRIPPADKVSILASQLRSLPPGLTEWAIHPGVVDDELKAVMADPLVPGVTATVEGRESDFAAVMSVEMADIVRQKGIQIINYRVLQRFWRREGLP